MDCDRGEAADREAGVVIVIVAAAMATLSVLVALVVDGAGAQRDREANQVAADAIAIAAATRLHPGGLNNEPACRAAWSYFVSNLSSAAPAAAPSCSAMAAPCAPATARQVKAVLGEYTVTLVNPVPAGHRLLGDRPQEAAVDGRACDRFGVEIAQRRPNLLAEGAMQLRVTAVGRLVPGVGDVLAPLVLLEPTACDVLTVSGTALLSVATAAGEPGYIDIDSDASGCATNRSVVLDLDGRGAIQAGAISMWALAGPDAVHAYQANVTPLPQPSSGPVGRNAVDWRYNCSAANGCPYSTPAHLDQLRAAYGGTGAPAGFTRWTSYYSCSPLLDIVVPRGNWYVDCPSGVSTSARITFRGGTIVADGPFTIGGLGSLRVNCDVLLSLVSCPADPASPSILYLRSGGITRTGNTSLLETFVYLQAGSLDLSGNALLTWTAPNDPTHPFDDLLVWTDSSSLMKITGTPGMQLTGTFFAPNASVELGGTTGATTIGAQLFTRNMSLVGTSSMLLRPDRDRMTPVGRSRSILVR